MISSISELMLILSTSELGLMGHGFWKETIMERKDRQQAGVITTRFHLSPLSLALVLH